MEKDNSMPICEEGNYLITVIVLNSAVLLGSGVDYHPLVLCVLKKKCY